MRGPIDLRLNRSNHEVGSTHRRLSTQQGQIMGRKGSTQLTYVIIASSELTGEGDRIFRSHQTWMEATHHREGEKALLSYDVSKVPELLNQLDPSSEPTGNTIFVLSEVYQTDAGVADHFEQAAATWPDFGSLMDWMEKCDTTLVPSARIVNSLW